MRGTHEPSLGELVGRLIDSGKAFVQAEIAVVRRTFAIWSGAAKVSAVFMVAAMLLINAAVIVLVAAFGMALAKWLGVAGGLAAAAFVVLLIAGLLVWLAIRRLASVAK